MSLVELIGSRDAKVGIIGLGYVGFPLAIAFSRAGFQVTGFDLDPAKVERLNRGESYIKHIPAEDIQEITQSGHFRPTTDFSQLAQMNCILICVPTPLNKNREPDLSCVLDTTRTIAQYLQKGQLIVLESSTYPGTTDEDMRKILEADGMSAGSDFYLAYSPEREDPNNQDFTISTIPKVVGGFTPDSRPEQLGGISVGEALLAPHKSYLPALDGLLETGHIKGLAHITGGGLVDNVPRILPDGCSFEVDLDSWSAPPLFRMLVELGHLEDAEAYRALNMGVGMVLTVAKADADRAIRILRETGEAAFVLGEVASGDEGVALR